MARYVTAFCMLMLVAVAPPAAAQATVLLFDDFDDGDALGWTQLDGNFQVVDGIYEISSAAHCQDARAIAGQASWTDYSIDVDFKYGASHLPILFRVEEVASGCDAGRYYQFWTAPDGAGICRMDYSGGQCSVLTTVPIGSTKGVWHHARLEVLGTSLVAYIDGALVIQYDGLTQYPHGRVGLKTINCCTNQFDNVLVQSLDAATAAGPRSPRAAWDRILACSPSPFYSEAVIAFDTASSGFARLSVYNVAGCVVRRIVAQELPGGAHFRTWNGRDDAGRAVAAGTYFCRLDTARGSQTLRVLRLR